MRSAANRHRRDVEFQIGDCVLLKLQQYRQHSVARPISTKLARRFYGPFVVTERIGQVAYRLELPPGSRIHNVFHVSLLHPYVESSSLDIADFPTNFARGKPVATPLKLADRRMVLKDGVTVEEGLLQWSDDGGQAPTWEPIQVIEKYFPGLFLEDKEVFMEGGVDTGTSPPHVDETTDHHVEEIAQPESELDNQRHPTAEEPQVFDTELAEEVQPAASAASSRPRRQARPPEKYGDYVSY